MVRTGLGLVLLLAAACGEVSSPQTPDGGGDNCPNNCDDGNSCTADSCVANECVHETMHGQQVFTANNSIQTFSPMSCIRTITVEASGAQGGNAITNNQPGGLGARIKGDFAITEGTSILVLVGHPGGSTLRHGGGGGGSFVWNPGAIPLTLSSKPPACSAGCIR